MNLTLDLGLGSAPARKMNTLRKLHAENPWLWAVKKDWDMHTVSEEELETTYRTWIPDEIVVWRVELLELGNIFRNFQNGYGSWHVHLTAADKEKVKAIDPCATLKLIRESVEPGLQIVDLAINTAIIVYVVKARRLQDLHAMIFSDDLTRLCE